MANFFLSMFASARRRLIALFFKNYLKKSLAERKGNCRQCGSCCATINCPYLSKDKKCKIFEKAGYFCKVYPIDRTDQELAGVEKICGYYWEK